MVQVIPLVALVVAVLAQPKAPVPLQQTLVVGAGLGVSPQ
jgi:hypothetical protein